MSKNEYYHGQIPDDQHFISLAVESEGRKCREVGRLLHAWAKLWAERRGESKAAAARMLFKWTTELDFRCAKNLAKCINERTLLSRALPGRRVAHPATHNAPRERTRVGLGHVCFSTASPAASTTYTTRSTEPQGFRLSPARVSHRSVMKNSAST